MDRWGLYELLKGNRQLNDISDIWDIGSMDRNELLEGVIEYLLLRVVVNLRMVDKHISHF